MSTYIIRKCVQSDSAGNSHLYEVILHDECGDRVLRRRLDWGTAAKAALQLKGPYGGDVIDEEGNQKIYRGLARGSVIKRPI